MPKFMMSNAMKEEADCMYSTLSSNYIAYNELTISAAKHERKFHQVETALKRGDEKTNAMRAYLIDIDGMASVSYDDLFHFRLGIECYAKLAANDDITGNSALEQHMRWLKPAVDVLLKADIKENEGVNNKTPPMGFYRNIFGLYPGSVCVAYRPGVTCKLVAERFRLALQCREERLKIQSTTESCFIVADGCAWMLLDNDLLNNDILLRNRNMGLCKLVELGIFGHRGTAHTEKESAAHGSLQHSEHNESVDDSSMPNIHIVSQTGKDDNPGNYYADSTSSERNETPFHAVMASDAKRDTDRDDISSLDSEASENAPSSKLSVENGPFETNDSDFGGGQGDEFRGNMSTLNSEERENAPFQGNDAASHTESCNSKENMSTLNSEESGSVASSENDSFIASDSDEDMRHNSESTYEDESVGDDESDENSCVSHSDEVLSEQPELPISRRQRPRNKGAVARNRVATSKPSARETVLPPLNVPRDGRSAEIPQEQHSVLDPMTLEEQHQATETFGQRLETTLNTAHLDVLAGVTEMQNNPSYENEFVRVEELELVGGKKSDQKGRIVSWDNCFTPGFLNKLWEEVDKVPHVVPHKKAHDRRLRIAHDDSVPDCAEFLIGSDNHRYTSQPAQQHEKSLLQIGHWLFEQWADQMQEYAAQINKRPPQTLFPDMIQALVGSVERGGASYSWHDDASVLLCDTGITKVDGRERVKKGDIMTLTIVLCDHENSSVVSWREKDTVSNKKRHPKIGSITTGTCTVHWQLQGCQDAFEHSVQSKQQNQIGSGQKRAHQHLSPMTCARSNFNDVADNQPGKAAPTRRIVFSMRCTGRFQHTEQEKIRRLSRVRALRDSINNSYCTVNVLTHDAPRGRTVAALLGNGTATPSNESQEQMAATSRVLPLRLPHNGTQVQSVKLHGEGILTNSVVPTDQRRRVAPRLGPSRPVYQTLTHGTFMERLVKKGLGVDVIMGDNEDVIRHGPTHFKNEQGTTLLPGDRIVASSVYAASNLAEADRHHDCWSRDPDRLTTVVLRHGYKNDLIGIKEELERIVSGEQRQGNFWFGGVGGAATPAGAQYIPNSSVKATRYGVAGYMASSQETVMHKKRNGSWQCNANGSACVAASRRRLVHLFLVDETTLKRQTEMLIYLGWYKMRIPSWHQETPEEAETSLLAGGVKGDWQMMGTYRLECHLRFHVDAVLLPGEVGFSSTSGLCSPMRYLKVSQHDTRVIGIDIERQQGEAVVDRLKLGGENTLTMDKLSLHFMEKERYLEFMTSNVPDMSIKGAAISRQDFFKAMLHCAGAGFLRAHHHHTTVVSDKVETAGVLPLPEFADMGDTLRCTAFPLPNRGFDLTTLFIAESFEATQKRTVRNNDWLIDPSNCSAIADMLFGITCMRITGRVQPFIKWRETQSVSVKEGQPLRLPTVSETEAFCTFVRRSARRGSDSVSDWRSNQMSSSIPKDCSTCQGLMTVIEYISLQSVSCAETIQELLRQPTSASREDMVEIIVNYIAGSLVHPDEFKTRRGAFIGHVILADMQECAQFETYDSVAGQYFLGFGGAEGIVAIRNAHVELKDKTDVEVMQWLLDYVQEQDETHLRVLGYDKNIATSSITNMLNGRPLGLVDIEHFLCKLAKLISRTHGNRIVNESKQSYPYCHPLPMKFHQWQQQTALMIDGCTKHYLSVSLTPMPNRLRVYGELPGEMPTVQPGKVCAALNALEPAEPEGFAIPPRCFGSSKEASSRKQRRMNTASIS